MAEQTAEEKIMTLLNSGWTVEDLEAVPATKQLMDQTSGEFRNILDAARDTT